MYRIELSINDQHKASGYATDIDGMFFGDIQRDYETIREAETAVKELQETGDWEGDAPEYLITQLAGIPRANS